jgi:predicted GNAT family acetyltransferase
MTIPPEVPVRHNPQAKRFEIDKEGSLAVLNYQVVAGKMIILHVEVPEAVGGLGLGSRLVAFALDYARAEGLQVVPLCSFAAGYIRKHPEYRDLMD